MIFTRENIDRIRAGRKTETRRAWRRPHVRVGGTYRLRAGRWAHTSHEKRRLIIMRILDPRGGDVRQRLNANEEP